MKKSTFLINIALFLFANTLIAQNNIDTIAIRISFPDIYQKAYAKALYVQGTDTAEFVLADTANYNIKWTGDSAPENDSVPNAIYNYGVDGNYTINLAVFEKATSTNFIFSQPVTIAKPSLVSVPNVFTPNNDSFNDLLTVFYDGITELEMTIFSRTGVQIIKIKAPTIVWDGRNSSGTIMSSGVYYYILKSADSVVDQNGFVHLF
ncbi:MAG: gliding motility-associated C-terminal domain-containing protein [Bacteroidales bacterium]|jgi:gliding motility-associated-like protein|nr:gliding motility-associated C-terminal domain-containing protein [Bacteroidales bacterium]